MLIRYSLVAVAIQPARDGDLGVVAVLERDAAGLVVLEGERDLGHAGGPRDSEPLKMTSSMPGRGGACALCSPMHQRMASTMFDLPQPFGPTTPVMGSLSKFTTVRSQNDLNPCTSSRFIRIAPRSCLICIAT